MNGFYSLWTKPSAGGAGREFAMQDHELACLLLSVAAYEEYNGRTRLYADKKAGAFFMERGLEDIFSRGMVEFEVPEDIDPNVFWAAGKLCALKLEDMPSVMIDTDLIIWRSIGRHLRDKSVAVIHREELNPAIYPDPGTFPVKNGYSYPKGWDFNIRPANTAMLYIRDKDFRDHYVKEALRFMQNLGPSQDNLCPMVFAEQRILPMCAAERGLSVYAFCPSMEGLREQDMFTHIWGHKNVFKFNMDERRGFVRRCMLRLKREFPEMYKKAAHIPELAEYAADEE